MSPGRAAALERMHRHEQLNLREQDQEVNANYSRNLPAVATCRLARWRRNIVRAKIKTISFSWIETIVTHELDSA